MAATTRLLKMREHLTEWWSGGWSEDTGRSAARIGLSY
jgi:hypothetical protein